MKKRSLPAVLAFSLATLVLAVETSVLYAQDTLQISLGEFIKRGVENSGQVDFERQSVYLAENQINNARSKRFLPTFELSTQHGAVPGVESDTNLEEDEYYLDPNLENDWNNWAVFTRAEINAVQPVFTWGALSSAVKAAQAGAEAARYEFEAQQTGLEIRLYELYYSFLLSEEVSALLDEAEGQMKKIEERIREKMGDEDSEMDESELYKFQVFQSEFGMRSAEVRENMAFIKSIWRYILQADEGTVYRPEDQFLDPVTNQIENLGFYKTQAMEHRAEIKGVEAGIVAAREGVEATKAQNMPMIFIGITGSYANTPNRPRQDNPFIINNTNYASAGIGLGVRQNLDFFSANTDIERRRIQYRQAKFLKDAAVDGIILEVSEKYKEASIAEARVDKTDEALVISKKWLRQEQLDYDFGIGETQDLIDAMQKEFELRFQLKQRIFEFNKNMAELFSATGLPLTSLNTAN